MKISIFGNTNNLLYLLACAIREAGHNVHLLVNQQETLHRPENIHPELAGNYPDWIHDVSDTAIEDYIGPSPKIATVLNVLEYADRLILNHVGPSLLPYIKKPAISFLTGSDLDYLARFETLSTLTGNWESSFRLSASAQLYRALWSGFITRQREGILRSRAVSFYPRGIVPGCDSLLDAIGVSDAQRIHLFLADDRIEQPRANKTGGRVRIFCGARLNWVRPMAPGTCELDCKGVDVLIRGLAAFHSRSGTKVELRLVEKGRDVVETHKLVDDLDLGDQVTWLQEMDRVAFDKELCQADICVDQLAQGAVGMTGADAMSCGKPLLANGRPEVWYGTWPEPPPICHATTAEEVADQLERLVPNRAERRRVGKESRIFAQKYWSPAANAEICLQKLTEE